MVNPFNKVFFRLVLGFTVILAFSCALLFFVTKYNIYLDTKSIIADKAAQ